MVPSPMANILLTNDDGIQAAALSVLAGALAPMGHVTVFAPERNWSAAGHTKTLHKPLRVSAGTNVWGQPTLVTSGAPSDCVGLALLGLVPEKLDLVVSGINLGANLGQDVTYSGTVAGAMEAAVFGVPAIAASHDLVEGFTPDFGYAAKFVVELAGQILQRGLPYGVLLNVNFPALPPEAVKGIRFTRLGRRVYRDVLIERLDPRGRPYYWIGGEPPAGMPDEGTDIGALAEGFVSITPLNMDMTDRAQLAEVGRWELALPDLTNQGEA